MEQYIIQGLTLAGVGWIIKKIHEINGSVKVLFQWKKDHERLHDIDSSK